MPTEEHILQQQITQYCRLRHFIVIDCDIMDGLKYAKDSARFPFIIHHKRMGYQKGQPDMIIMKNGKVWCLELKSAKGKQSKEQKEYQEMCIKNGIPYLVIKKLEDLKFLENC